MSLQKLIPNLVATLICWLSIGLVVAVTPSGAFIRDAVIGIAFLATATLWATWAVNNSATNLPAASEKAKRSAGNDANVALLLELLSEDERLEVKDRMLERMRTDGETSSLADLLDDPAPKARRNIG